MKENADARVHVQPYHFKEGETVLIRQDYGHSGKLIPPYKPQPYQITKQKGTMITAQNHEQVIVRNASKFKPIALEYKPVPECYASQSEEEAKEFPETDAPVTPQSPEAKTPRRYPVRRDRKKPA